MLVLTMERLYTVTHIHVQAFISFFQQTAQKKIVHIAAKCGTKKCKPGKTTTATEEVIVQYGDMLDQVAEREQEMLVGLSVKNDKDEVGEGADEAKEMGIAMSQKEKDTVLGLFPKVH